jgi:hypothetical protein
VQHDWDNYYKPFMNPIAGHTNTPTDPVGIRGFRVARGDGGVVGVQWKPKAESGEWRGADGQVNTPGFVVLKGRPRGLPAVIEPKRFIMDKKYYKQLTGKKMTECLEAEGAFGAKTWLAAAAKHGVLPIYMRLQELGDVTPGEFGSKVQLKCDDAVAEVQLIEDCKQTTAEFWTLPPEVLRVQAEGEQVAEALSRRHLLHPAVGYASVPLARRPTYEGSAAQAHAAEEKEEEKSSEDESSEDEEPLIQNNASRAQPSDEDRQAPKRRREVPAPEPEEEIEEVTHDVIVLFGNGDFGQEMWVAIKVKGGRAGKVKVQFLEAEGLDGMYCLTGQCESYKPSLIKHTFPAVTFLSTTTYKLTKKTQRRVKKGAIVKIVTKEVLDQNILVPLFVRCRDIERESNSDGSDSS